MGEHENTIGVGVRPLQSPSTESVHAPEFGSQHATCGQGLNGRHENVFAIGRPTKQLPLSEIVHPPVAGSQQAT